MPKLQQYIAEVQPGVEGFATLSTPAAFGVKTDGEVIGDLADFLEKKANSDDLFHIQKDMAKFRGDWAKYYQEREQNAEVGAVNFVDNFMRDYDKAAGQMMAERPLSDENRSYLYHELSSVRQGLLERAIQFEAKGRAAAFTSDWVAMSTQQTNNVVFDPSSLPSEIGAMEAAVDNAVARGMISEQHGEDLKWETHVTLVQAAIQGWIDIGLTAEDEQTSVNAFDKASKMLSEDPTAPFLDGETILSMKENINKAQEKRLSDKTTAALARFNVSYESCRVELRTNGTCENQEGILADAALAFRENPVHYLQVQKELASALLFFKEFSEISNMTQAQQDEKVRQWLSRVSGIDAASNYGLYVRFKEGVDQFQTATISEAGEFVNATWEDLLAEIRTNGPGDTDHIKKVIDAAKTAFEENPARLEALTSELANTIRYWYDINNINSLSLEEKEKLLDIWKSLVTGPGAGYGLGLYTLIQDAIERDQKAKDTEAMNRIEAGYSSLLTAIAAGGAGEHIGKIAQMMADAQEAYRDNPYAVSRMRNEIALSIRLYEDTHKINLLDEDEQKKLVATWWALMTKGPNANFASGYFKIIKDAVAESRRQLAEDPALFVEMHNEQVKRLFLAARTDEQKQLAIAASLAEQKRLGVPDHALRPISKDQAANLAAEINALADNDPEAAGDLVQQTARFYQQWWRYAATALADAGLDGDYVVVSDLTELRDAFVMKELVQAIRAKKLMEDSQIYRDNAKQIKQKVEEELKPFIWTFTPYGPAGMDYAYKYVSAAVSLAMYAMFRNKDMDADDAVEYATNTLVFDRNKLFSSELLEMVRVDPDVDEELFTWIAKQTLINLNPQDLVPVFGGDMPNSTQHEDVVKANHESATQGYYVNNPDNTGVILLNKQGQPVLTYDWPGRTIVPVEIKFADLDGLRTIYGDPPPPQPLLGRF